MMITCLHYVMPGKLNYHILHPPVSLEILNSVPPSPRPSSASSFSLCVLPPFPRTAHELPRTEREGCDGGAAPAADGSVGGSTGVHAGGHRQPAPAGGGRKPQQHGRLCTAGGLLCTLLSLSQRCPPAGRSCWTSSLLGASRPLRRQRQRPAVRRLQLSLRERSPQQVAYLSSRTDKSRGKDVRAIHSGVHGLANGSLDEWASVERGKALLGRALSGGGTGTEARAPHHADGPVVEVDVAAPSGETTSRGRQRWDCACTRAPRGRW